MPAGLVWEPVGPDGVRDLVSAAAGRIVTVTAGDQRCMGTLGLGQDRLTFEVTECSVGMDEASELVRMEFDEGRYLVRLWVRLDEASPTGWLLHWPEHGERRDRRRFARNEPTEACTLALADQEPSQPVVLVDLSVNGASFLGPPGRLFLRGQRLPARVRLDGQAPAPILLEVLGVGQDERGRSVVRGRFLAPEDGTELDLAELGASPGVIDDLNRVLAAVAADATPAGVLRAFAPPVRREPE